MLWVLRVENSVADGGEKAYSKIHALKCFDAVCWIKMKYEWYFFCYCSVKLKILYILKYNGKFLNILMSFEKVFHLTNIL